MLSHSKRGRENEKKISKLLGGRMQVNSGTFWFSKADFKVEDFLVDNKATLANYYTLSRKTWEKIRVQAIKARKCPAMTLGMGKYDTLTNRHEHEAVIVDYLPDGVSASGMHATNTESTRIGSFMIEELDKTISYLWFMGEPEYKLYIVGLSDFQRYYLKGE